MIQLIADGLIIPLVLVAGWALWRYVPRDKRFDYYSYALMAGLTSLLTAKLMSLIYQPATGRPFEQLGEQASALYLDNPGFPSDHMLFATVIVVAVWALTRKRRLSLILAVIALLIGIGRVLALVHTPLDVAGGIAAGLIGGVWYLVLIKKR